MNCTDCGQPAPADPEPWTLDADGNRPRTSRCFGCRIDSPYAADHVGGM